MRKWQSLSEGLKKPCILSGIKNLLTLYAYIEAEFRTENVKI